MYPLHDWYPPRSRQAPKQLDTARRSRRNRGLLSAPSGVRDIILPDVRRATVTIPDELEEALESYRRDLEFPPSLAAVLQASLDEYLRRRGYVADEETAEGGPPPMYGDAPTVRGTSASRIVLEDRR